MGEKSLRLKLELKERHHNMMMARRDKEIQRLKWENDELKEKNYKLKERVQKLEKYNRTDEWDWQSWAYKVVQEKEDLGKELERQLKINADNINAKIWHDHIIEYTDKLDKIHSAIRNLQYYHRHYDQLVSSLNIILRVKHDLSILDKQDIDDALKQGLKLVKLLNRFTESKSEIYDLVTQINDEYKKIKTIGSNAEWAYTKFFPGKNPTSFFDVFNKLFESHNNLKARLKAIDNVCFDVQWYSHGKIIKLRDLIHHFRSMCDLKNENAINEWIDIYD